MFVNRHWKVKTKVQGVKSAPSKESNQLKSWPKTMFFCFILINVFVGTAASLMSQSLFNNIQH